MTTKTEPKFKYDNKINSEPEPENQPEPEPENQPEPEPDNQPIQPVIPEAPSYASLISLNSKTVDIAALGQKITAPVQEDSHIVKTELIYLGKDEFKKLFFSNDGENFSINRQLYDDYNNDNVNTEVNIKEFNDVMTFNKRFKMVDTDSNNIEPLILSEHIFSCYEKDTGTDRDCWEVCSVMNMQKLLNSIRCLCDMGVGCNVLSSLKWSEVESIINSETTDSDDNLDLLGLALHLELLVIL